MCTLFLVVDFTLIANTAMDFILRQTTYFNHLMSYVNSFENINDVQEVVYGQEFTSEFLESYSTIIGGKINEQSLKGADYLVFSRLSKLTA